MTTSHQEAALPSEIFRRSPESDQRRYEQLIAKRQQETIKPGELRELIGMTEQCEQRDVERLAALIELARMRGVSLDALMATPGITVASGASVRHHDTPSG